MIFINKRNEIQNIYGEPIDVIDQTKSQLKLTNRSNMSVFEMCEYN